MSKLVKIEKAETLSWKTEDDNNLKCGEIVLSNNIQFCFSCIFCNQTSDKVQEFFRHVLYDHLNYLEEYQFSDDEEYSVQKILKPNEAKEPKPNSVAMLTGTGLKGENCIEVDKIDYDKHFENFVSNATPNSYIKSEIEDEEIEFDFIQDCDSHSQAVSCRSPEGSQSKPQDILHIEILEDRNATEFGVEQTTTQSNENTSEHHSDDENDPVYSEQKDYDEEDPDHEEETIAAKENVHNCPHCKKTFSTETGMKRHIGNIHKASPDSLTCEMCSKNFKNEIQLDLHMKRHMGIKPHTCEICGSCFSDKSNLNVHILRHKGIKPHKCTLCEKRFHSTTEQKLHMRSHTGERPFVCEVCGRKFSNSGHLCSHRRRHFGEKRFQCDHCEKRFFDRKLLNDHKVIHTDERPFACDLCGSTFQRKKALLQHEKLHSSVKQYVCKICGKSFAQNAGLYSHMKYH